MTRDNKHVCVTTSVLLEFLIKLRQTGMLLFMIVLPAYKHDALYSSCNVFTFWLICVRQLCGAYVSARKVNNKTTELPTLIATVIYGQNLSAIRLVLVIVSRNPNLR